MSKYRQYPVINRLAWLMLPLLLFGSFLWLPWHSQAQPAEPLPVTEATVTVWQNDEMGLAFRLDLPQASVTDEMVTVAGLEARLQEPGAPALPYYATWLAIPPGADVTVTVSDGTVSSYQVGYIQAAPGQGSQPIDNLPAAQRDAYAQVGVEAVPLTVEAPDMEIYGRAQPYPQQRYHLSQPVYYRDVQMVALHLYPLRYNPVSQQLTQAHQLQVQVNFSRADLTNLRPAARSHPTHDQLLAGLLLNYETSRAWRSFPHNLQPFTPALPLGVPAYKIEIEQDGIYEISGAELAAQGMDLSSIDPHTIEMMHRGQPVAYQFVGNLQNGFQPTDRIRFYGWAFDAPRLEKQYISHNVYWLWAGGAATTINTIANETGQGHPPVYTFPDEITRAPENLFWGTWTNKWDQFANEPDAWFWEHVSQNVDILTKTYAITLPHPALTAADALYTVELMSREQTQAPTNFFYDVRATINEHNEYGQTTWQLVRNVNVTGTVPNDTLQDGANDVHVVYATERSASPGDPRYYLNRITVNYERQLVALDDQLQFGTESSGSQEFQVANFSQANSNQVLVWDVTNPYHPNQITLTNADIVGGGPYTYRIGHTGPKGRRYLATTNSNIQTVAGLSTYTAASITPPQGADWVAISHADFRPAAEQLATHRAGSQFGGLVTYVVDVEDIINQYGYGLPLPEAIRNYLTTGLLTWETPPSYLLLVGQGHQNPRNLMSHGPSPSYPWWDKDLPSYVPTDLVFEDRFQGLIPSDHTFTTLIGDDLVPDLAVGRIATASITDTYHVVNKIIQYDLNQLTPAAWQHHYLFVADTTDQGGNFCLANQQTGNSLADSIEQTHLCRPTATPGDTAQLRVDMSAAIHDPDHGVILLNYRGHGSVDRWAGPAILDTTMTDFWENEHKPLIILSADCLDGNFAWPGWPALSQTFLALPEVGSAAHWSSTGLGYTVEHSVLLQALYEGAFDLDLAALGQAINHSKIQYMLGGHHISEIYSFTLQGDPAMQLYRIEYSNFVYLPYIAR